jgi:flagellar biosynthetic protein FlhB
MAESADDKTEAPTPRRRQEAAEQGNVARSSDLTSAALLVGAMVLFKWFGMGIIAALYGVVMEMLGRESMANLDPDQVAPPVLHAVGSIALALAPLFGGLAIIVILANVLQVGFQIHPERLAPNFAALNPIRGLGKIFGGGRGVVFLLMSLLKVVLVAAVAYSAIGNRIGQIIAVQQLDFVQIFGAASDVIYSIGLRVGILLLVLAIIDYVYQRYRLEVSLRMTKQEVKEEMRRMDGDPHIKQRRRQIAMQRHKQRLKKEVPKANVIITNPTHYAVALQYEEKTMHAPKLVAKGADLIARYIRELAVEAGVPIVERASLARAIYKDVEIGQHIPEEFYAAVAEILAYVFELNRKATLVA